MRVRRCASGTVIAIVAVLFMTRGAGAQQSPVFSVARAYEENATYTEPLFSVNTPCLADDLRFQIDWGNGQFDPMTLAPGAAFPTPVGNYGVLSKHKFGAAGSSTVRVQIGVHCY